MTYSYNLYNTLLTGEIVTNPSVVLPYNKQTPLHQAWLNDLIIEPVQRLNDLKFIDYDLGSTYSSYSASVVYHIGDRINGGLTYNNNVFEANSTTTGTFSTNNWTYILPSFVGFEERLKYVDSRIVFEYALNRYFMTAFRQPNYADTQKSDIYIKDDTTNFLVFEIGSGDFDSGFIGVDNSTLYGPVSSNVWIGPDPSIYPVLSKTFTIMIPGTFSRSLPGWTGVTGSTDNVIKNFANTINYAGMLYDVETY